MGRDRPRRSRFHRSASRNSTPSSAAVSPIPLMLTEKPNCTGICTSFKSSSKISLLSKMPAAMPPGITAAAHSSVSQTHRAAMWRFSRPRML